MTYCEVPGCGQLATYEKGWSLRCSQHKRSELPPQGPQGHGEAKAEPSPSLKSPSPGSPSGVVAFQKDVAACVECKSRGDGDYCPEHFHKAKKVADVLDEAPGEKGKEEG